MSIYVKCDNGGGGRKKKSIIMMMMENDKVDVDVIVHCMINYFVLVVISVMMKKAVVF